MKKLTYLPLLVITVVLAQTFSSCKKDSSSNSTSNPEYVADSSSFQGFMSWSKDKTNNGPDPLLGAMAHANNDSSVVRDVYFKNGQAPVNGTYPIGTLIVKHSHNPAGTVDEHTAMAKRGNNFNSGYGDWEFFMLTSTGKIATDSTGMQMRGANLMNGMCKNCHSAASHDLVFSK